MISYWSFVDFVSVGRGHGFAELNGVPFKIADKYDVYSGHSEIANLVSR